MSANDVFDNGSAAISLWRRLLETEIELEEANDGADLVGDLDDVDEDELAAAQDAVFARLGVAERSVHDVLLAAFLVDLENWRVSASTLALARDVGSLAETVEVLVPDLGAEGFNEVVELECDLDEGGRVCDLAVMISTPDTDRPVTVTVTEPNGTVHAARVSEFGLARFFGLAIEPAAGGSLRFELRW